MDLIYLTLYKLIEIIEYRQKKLKACYHPKEPAIYMRERQGNNYFFELFDGKTKGITGDRGRILNLTRNLKIKEELVALAFNKKILQSAAAGIKKSNLKRINAITDTFDANEKYYNYLDWQWMNEAYEQNPFRKEDLKYTTPRGLKVRSKSELLIASCLERRNIPFRYEAKFVLEGRVCYPDFIIRRPDGTFVIWEHFGLMDDDEYFGKALEKIEEYRREGFVQHKNLICTYEEDVRNEREINSIIDFFLFV